MWVLLLTISPWIQAMLSSLHPKVAFRQPSMVTKSEHRSSRKSAPIVISAFSTEYFDRPYNASIVYDCKVNPQLPYEIPFTYVGFIIK